jgi:hypothetical protein
MMKSTKVETNGQVGKKKPTKHKLKKQVEKMEKNDSLPKALSLLSFLICKLHFLLSILVGLR